MSNMNIVRVRYAKPQLEEQHLTLVDFTPAFLNANRTRIKPLTRQEVEWHWEEQVMKTYPDSDDERRVFFLEQKSCPAIQQFWEKRNDAESWEAKRTLYSSQYTFYQSHRNLSEAERKADRWAVIMTSAATGDIIVPDIRVFPLFRVSYLETAKKVLAANPRRKLEKHEMEDLWDGIMDTVYDFEVTLWDRKKHELISGTAYRKLQEEAKISRKRKRGEHCDVSDNSDNEDLSTTEVQTEAKAVETAEPNLRTSTSESTKQFQTSYPSTLAATEESKVNMSPATLAAIVPSPTPPVTRTLASIPSRSSDQAPQPPTMQVRPDQERGRGRGRGRGSSRGIGSGPRQSIAGQRAPVNPQATLIPTPTRRTNPPTATAPTTSVRPSSTRVPGTNWNPTESEYQEMRETRIADVGRAQFNKECAVGMWRRWPKNQYER